MSERKEAATQRRIDQPWDPAIDPIPDDVLPKFADFIRSMADGFEVKSMQAHTNSVTCTISFDGKVGPEAQADAMDRMFRAHTLIETLFVNLRHERGEDVEDPDDNGSSGDQP